MSIYCRKPLKTIKAWAILRGGECRYFPSIQAFDIMRTRKEAQEAVAQRQPDDWRIVRVEIRDTSC